MRCYACFGEVAAGATRCPHCTTHLNGFGAPPGHYSKSGGPVYDTVSWIIIAAVLIYCLGVHWGWWAG